MLPSVTFVSTYPPTRCGLATFTESLRTAMARNRGSEAGLDVLAVAPSGDLPPEVVGTIDPVGAKFLRARTDLAILQHEYGIFGGNDGEAVVDLVDSLGVPVVTVLEQPSPRQRRIVEQLARQSINLVVMSNAAQARLVAAYRIGDCPVTNIPHGGWSSGPRRVHRRHERPVILTWGLLGPGKGLENAIRALPALVDLDPRPLYVIAGQTHPGVLKTTGERYREYLEGLVTELGVDDMVRFFNRYLSAADLHSLRRRASVCLFPYESRDQVTSGALVEALVGQVPVVATPFPHAVELLSTGAGLLVEYDDSASIAAALRKILTNRGTAATATSALERLAADLSWPGVARKYESLLQGVGLDAGAA
jgi:glycosyltransferase involved in cell wall biosynthesis